MRSTKTSVAAAAVLALAWLGTSANAAFAEDAIPEETVVVESPAEEPEAVMFSNEDQTEETPVDETLVDDSGAADSGVSEQQQRSLDNEAAPLMAASGGAEESANDTGNSSALPLALGAVAVAAAGAYAVKRRRNNS